MGEFPSKENQFKPGESGNPRGRKTGSKNLSTLLKEMLEQEIEWVDPITGQKIRQKYKAHINAQLLKKAIAGDARAINAIFDRTEGRPKSGDAPGDDVNVGGVLAVPNAQGLTSEEWEKQYAEHNAKIAEKVNEKSQERVVRV